MGQLRGIRRPAPNARFRKMAALPRVDNFFIFSRRVLALKGADEPPLREAATTLYATGGQGSKTFEREKLRLS